MMNKTTRYQNGFDVKNLYEPPDVFRLPSVFLVRDFSLSIGFFLGISLLPLDLDHKWENHRSALGALVIESVQRIPDLGIYKTPFGYTTAAVVERLYQKLAALFNHVPELSCIDKAAGNDIGEPGQFARLPVDGYNHDDNPVA